MVTSLRIKNGNDISDPIIGNITLAPGNNMKVTGKHGNIEIGTDGLGIFKNGDLVKCPYVTTLSGVSPDAFGNVYLLGGTTAQVDFKDNGIMLCDMSQRNDSPIIFRAIYDMLRIIRRWLDAHKDSLLLSERPGENQWLGMQESDLHTDYYLTASDDDRPEFLLPVTTDVIADYRKRSDIVSLGPSLRLYNEYQAVVAMWNRIVKDPEAIVEIRIHPGDNAGIYIGVTSNIPLQNVSSDSTVVITTTIKVSFTGQDKSVDEEGNPTGNPVDNLYVWSRVMDNYCRIYPTRSATRDYSITFPGTTVIGSSDSAASSKLDRDGRIIKYPAELVAEYTETLNGKEETLANTYTSQMLYEVIPFCMCSGETSYADSLVGLHYVQQDTNNWTIDVLVQYTVDDVLQDYVINKSYTKETMYAEVCKDPYKDMVPDDARPEDNSDSTS